jgi:hypothetical protein
MKKIKSLFIATYLMHLDALAFAIPRAYLAGKVRREEMIHGGEEE